MPSLCLTLASGAEVSYPLQGTGLVVGRAPECDVVLGDPLASRQHLEIRAQAGAWQAVDRGSRNGSRFNGEPLTRPALLRDGDRIEIGSIVLTYRSARVTAIAETEAKSPDGRAAPLPSAALVGKSAVMHLLRARIERVAASRSSVLLSGESGTGKELAARLLHALSRQAKAPFEVVNCPALPASLLEAELFGVERGAATGVGERDGKLVRANGGTLFLDEVGDLDLAAQAKLLRFLQDRVVERVGGGRPIAVDVRIVAATNRDLEAAVTSGGFRLDLYHRLKVVSIHLPPLRERPEDIPLLVEHFLAAAPAAQRKTISAAALEALNRHSFPGNVRELQHLLESAALLCEASVIDREHIPGVASRAASGGGSVTEADAQTSAEALYQRVRAGESFWTTVRAPFLARNLERGVVRCLFQRLYQDSGGSHKKAAALLGLDDDYKRFLDFVRYRRLRVRDLFTPSATT